MFCPNCHLQQKHLEASEAQLEWRKLNGVLDEKKNQSKNFDTDIYMLQQAFVKMQFKGIYGNEVDAKGEFS